MTVNAALKLTSNAAPNLKWWSLSLLQMVSLFQAQASTKMAVTENGVYVNNVTISSILVENINSKASKIQP
jgi:predicted transcriptional regulator